MIVYTAIFGSIRDVLHEPAPCPGVRYIAFMDVDKVSTVNGWEVRPALFQMADARRKARKHKTLSHLVFPNEDVTLWLDGCLTPLPGIDRMPKEYLEATGLSIATSQHSERNCVYRELYACLQHKKDDASVMRKQIERYRRENYPYNNGLAETGAVLRKHTEDVCKLNDMWWQEIEKGSCRDQLSFNYVAWRLGIRYAILRGPVRRSPHFKWVPHR